MSRYVVTGAAGFIASHLAEALLAAGNEVVALDCFSDHYDQSLKERNARGLDVLRLDAAEDPLEEIVGGADGVFHLAGKPGVRSGWGRDFAEYVHDNVLATQRLFEVAASARVRVVWASSSSIYGEAATYPTPEHVEPRPLSPYGVTKLTCERLADVYMKGEALDVVTLRYFTVYGPRQRPDMAFTRVTSALAEGRQFELFGDGSQSRGFTYVADAVDATIAAMQAAPGGAVYNVGGGSEATMGEAISMLEDISGRSLDLVLGESVTGDVRRTSADTTLIRQALGWTPRTSLEEGLAAQWRWAAERLATSAE